MARILLKQPGQTVADFAVAGAAVTVAGLTIDTAQRETDGAVTVEIRTLDGVVREGGHGHFLAQIEIPARLYTQTEGEPDAETGLPRIMQTPVPFDPRRVSVTLWPAA